MQHFGVASNGQGNASDVTVLEMHGPDADGRIGVSIGRHQGSRTFVWLNPGAARDALGELQDRLSRAPRGVSTVRVEEPSRRSL